MKASAHLSIKKALSSALMVTLLGTTFGCTAVASDHGSQNYNQSTYRDGNFGTLAQKLRHDLSRSGYQVMDIQADNYRGNQSLVVYAKKNNQPYELKYTYPALKLISSSQKDWSNVWRDKNHHNGNNHNDNYNNRYNHGNAQYNGKYNNTNHRNKNSNIENNLRKEARYPAIKQRAVRKVENMGYKVKKIELDEKNNRGVFEIEAKRGNQDYDIVLGYPNLNVIKLEKD